MLKKLEKKWNQAYFHTSLIYPISLIIFFPFPFSYSINSILNLQFSMSRSQCYIQSQVQNTLVQPCFEWTSCQLDISSLKVFNAKKLKVYQVKRLQKSKNDLYSKLSRKLEEELREIKNHHTAQARQKIALLEKCRVQRHTRRKKTAMREETSTKQSKSENVSMHRPFSCNPRSQKPDKNKSNTKENENRITFSKQNNWVSFMTRRFQKIKNDCCQYKSTLMSLKDDFDTLIFYNKLVNKNSSIIYTKML